MGRLSPSIISPSNLRQLLLDVKARLPTTLKLPNDPQVDLWFFYKHLTCITVLETDTILIVISIPLLDLNGKFEVFKAISVPFPLPTDQGQQSNLPDMVAVYDLEATDFIINRERTKYALLSQKEKQHCSDQSTTFCAIENAIFPINLSKLCVIALFMKNEDAIKRFCQKVVHLDTTLPTAIHLFQNKWAIASKKELRFSTVCHDESKDSQTSVAKPVVDLIQLKQTCFAFNDFFTLAPTYIEGRSHFNIEDANEKLLTFKNISNMGIWKPFNTKFPSLTKVTIPKKLKDIPRVPMNKLIDELVDLQNVNLDNGFPYWVGVLIEIGLISVIIIGGVYCKCKGKCRNKLKAKMSNEQKQLIVTPNYQYQVVPTSSGDPGRINIPAPARFASAPSAEADNFPTLQTTGSGNVVQKMYPTLSMTGPE